EHQPRSELSAHLHAGRAISGVYIVWRVLVAEPGGKPGTIGALASAQKVQTAADALLGVATVNSNRQFLTGTVADHERIPAAKHCSIPVRRFRSTPSMKRSEDMSGQVGAATVERKCSPAAAKGRPTAVAVLQCQEP